MVSLSVEVANAAPIFANQTRTHIAELQYQAEEDATKLLIMNHQPQSTDSLVLVFLKWRRLLAEIVCTFCLFVLLNQALDDFFCFIELA
jgi:hypothetical protein